MAQLKNKYGHSSFGILTNNTYSVKKKISTLAYSLYRIKKKLNFCIFSLSVLLWLLFICATVPCFTYQLQFSHVNSLFMLLYNLLFSSINAITPTTEDWTCKVQVVDKGRQRESIWKEK
ncbi:uncharacterized protein LOC124885655 [Capsicum annuum]|uniref:uncharacterized protein LOC124885655 n=1 Tax=Capsicum annuum TaxID=4072 RepID=UPI001FB139C8|nr:uncharacterized protein LOC124885655 [Capsicum annuum]